MPRRVADAYRAVLAELAKGHRFRHWDLADEPLADAEFRDTDHLSVSGARAFTRRLLERLDSRL